MGRGRKERVERKLKSSSIQAHIQAWTGHRWLKEIQEQRWSWGRGMRQKVVRGEGQETEGGDGWGWFSGGVSPWKPGWTTSSLGFPC